MNDFEALELATEADPSSSRVTEWLNRHRWLRYLLVSLTGFLIDTATLVLLIESGVSPFLARLLSFVPAIFATWQLNRRYTFHDRKPAAKGRGWVYAAVYLTGNLINYVAFATMIAWSAWAHRYYLVPFVLAAMLALVCNYVGIRAWVFKSPAAKAKAPAL